MGDLHSQVLYDVSGELLDERIYPGHPFSIEVSRVCQQTCNGGWMSDLENAVRPRLERMLLGRGSSLNVQDQTTLSTWAYKTALMVNFALPEVARAADPSEYRYLFRHKRPPPGAKGALAAYDGEPTASFRGHPLHVGSQVRGGNPRGAFNGYTLTLSVGQVAFHVFHTTVPGQELAYGGGDITSQLQWIWPAQKDLIVWTPQPALDEDAFVALADALGRPN